ncbi:unnamed protein product [Cochlearia groenlandica]
MNQSSLVLSILLLLVSSLSQIQARDKSHPTAKSPVATPAPGPSNSDCSNIIYSMMDCLTYLGIPSNDTKPGKECCDGILTVLEYNPKCICVGLESSKQMGIPLNNTRALSVPTTCKLPIAAPHCVTQGVSSPSISTPGSSPASPSASGTPTTSPSSAESPKTSSADSPAVSAPAPSRSSTSNLSVPFFTLLAIFVSFISVFSI